MCMGFTSCEPISYKFNCFTPALALLFSSIYLSFLCSFFHGITKHLHPKRINNAESEWLHLQDAFDVSSVLSFFNGGPHSASASIVSSSSCLAMSFSSSSLLPSSSLSTFTRHRSPGGRSDALLKLSTVLVLLRASAQPERWPSDEEVRTYYKTTGLQSCYCICTVAESCTILITPLVSDTCEQFSSSWSDQRAWYGKIQHLSICFLPTGGCCTDESFVKPMACNIDRWLNTNSLEAATPSSQEVNSEVSALSVSSSLVR